MLLPRYYTGDTFILNNMQNNMVDGCSEALVRSLVQLLGAMRPLHFYRNTASKGACKLKL